MFYTLLLIIVINDQLSKFVESPFALSKCYSGGRMSGIVSAFEKKVGC